MPEEQIPPGGATEQFDRCEQCHAPVDKDQRYCVNCGAHQRQVADPAAKYMSRVSAHTGTRGALSSSPAGVALVRSTARSGFFGGLGVLGALALVALALIPVAAAVGVVIGRSSNNHDPQLIQALEKQRAQVTTTLVGSSGTAASSTGSASASSSTASRKKTAKKTAGKKSKTAAASSAASKKATKITGAKVTASQQSQGSSEAKKIQSSTGKNYVQAANNLPPSVVVGP